MGREFHHPAAAETEEQKKLHIHQFKTGTCTQISRSYLHREVWRYLLSLRPHWTVSSRHILREGKRKRQGAGGRHIAQVLRRGEHGQVKVSVRSWSRPSSRLAATSLVKPGRGNFGVGRKLLRGMLLLLLDVVGRRRGEVVLTAVTTPGAVASVGPSSSVGLVQSRVVEAGLFQQVPEDGDKLFARQVAELLKQDLEVAAVTRGAVDALVGLLLVM